MVRIDPQLKPKARINSRFKIWIFGGKIRAKFCFQTSKMRFLTAARLGLAAANLEKRGFATAIMGLAVVSLTNTGSRCSEIETRCSEWSRVKRFLGHERTRCSEKPRIKTVFYFNLIFFLNFFKTYFGYNFVHKTSNFINK